MREIKFGIPALFPPKHVVNEKGLIEDYILQEDEDIWCDFSLEYDSDKNCYYFCFETFLGFEEKDGCRNWIISCLSHLTEYMQKNGYDTSKELDMYQVFTDGVNVNSYFESIEDAYAFMKFVVFGFHGNDLYQQSMRKDPINNYEDMVFADEYDGASGYNKCLDDIFHFQKNKSDK